jgi:ribosomal protein S18 acetylase RimI-like enzyme
MPKDYIEPLNKENISLKENFCTVENEDEFDYFKIYLDNNGLLDNKQGIAKTWIYIIEDDDGNRTMAGFYAIRCSSLIMDIGSKEKIGEPAIEIVELAVHRDYRYQGIGTRMMQDIIATAFELKDKYLGVKHLVVCAKKSAKDYYKDKFKFSELPGHKQIPRNGDNIECIGMSLSLRLMD